MEHALVQDSGAHRLRECLILTDTGDGPVGGIRVEACQPVGNELLLPMQVHGDVVNEIAGRVAVPLRGSEKGDMVGVPVVSHQDAAQVAEELRLRDLGHPAH